jgi:formylglycine-generating enzyme
VGKGIIHIFYIVLIFSNGLLMAQEKTFTNSIGMEFVRIEPGSMIVGKFQPPYPVPEDTVKGGDRPMNMWMGDGRPYNDEEFRLAKEMAMRDAQPGFEVYLSNPYYIGKFEVTQEQWTKVMGSNPSVFQGPKVDHADGHPVDNVTWQQAQEFLKRLNEREKGKRYRLPSEFEWEYAARAGAEGDIAWSETQLVAQLGTATTQVVGQKKPNPWGLYDMLGNVWEWVGDFYNEKIFADPQGPTSGETNVLKGASFVGDVKNATWLTHGGGPGNGWDVGFRVLLEITGE